MLEEKIAVCLGHSRVQAAQKLETLSTAQAQNLRELCVNDRFCREALEKLQ